MPKKQPEGSNAITPYFTLKNADKAIVFYTYVFGAEEEFRLDGPDGKIMHASLRIGDSQIMMTEERPEYGSSQGVTKGSTYVYVEDPDAAFARAKEKKAKILMEPMDMFYGDRTASFVDPFGQIWTVAMRIEDVSEEEMRKRADKMFNSHQA